MSLYMKMSMFIFLSQRHEYSDIEILNQKYFEQFFFQVNLREYMLGSMVKPALETPVSYRKVSGFKSQVCCQVQLPANAYSGEP